MTRRCHRVRVVGREVQRSRRGEVDPRARAAAVACMRAGACARSAGPGLPAVGRRCRRARPRGRRRPSAAAGRAAAAALVAARRVGRRRRPPRLRRTRPRSRRSSPEPRCPRRLLHPRAAHPAARCCPWSRRSSSSRATGRPCPCLGRRPPPGRAWSRPPRVAPPPQIAAGALAQLERLVRRRRRSTRSRRSTTRGGRDDESERCTLRTVP